MEMKNLSANYVKHNQIPQEKLKALQKINTS